MTKVTIAAVIPTRNRAEMAINAVRYLLRQPDCDLKIFVSDNSAGAEEVRRLADFCTGLDDPRVTYVRTPGDLPQGMHWDWAARYALAHSDATHVTIHYDRKITRPGAAADWFALAGRFPGKLFTYASDFVSAEPPPRRLWQQPWTGKVYLLKTARAVEVSARGQAFEVGQMLPILSNSIVPRAIVETLIERFGTFCESTTADSCFAYRFCALHDDYLHLDRPLTILYGSERSAAVGYLSGGGGDFADYRKTWRGASWLDAGVIPGLNLGYNMLFHEYELVRRKVGGDRLPPLDRDGCLRDLARGLAWIRDPKARSDLRNVLEEHGWNGEGEVSAPAPSPPRWRRVGSRLRQRAALTLADRFRIAPRTIAGFQFATDEEALHYAVRYPSRPTRNEAHLAIVEPLEIEARLP